MTILIAATLAAACGSSDAKTSSGGYSDPSAAAMAVLEAYKAKDYGRLVELAPPSLRDRAKKARAQTEKRLFTGWRWDAVQAWKGNIIEVRYAHFKGSAAETIEAHVHFGDISVSELAVLKLVREDGKWWFKSVISPSRGNFLENSSTPPKS